MSLDTFLFILDALTTTTVPEKHYELVTAIKDFAENMTSKIEEQVKIACEKLETEAGDQLSLLPTGSGDKIKK